jgi:hypothetical protein
MALIKLVGALAPACVGCVRADTSGHPIGVLGRATWAFQVGADQNQDQDWGRPWEGTAYQPVEEKAYRQEAGKACLGVVIQLRQVLEGRACH